ncbi:MAG: hypothetical protein ABEJ02_02170 [Candidatus Paceibacteria bacterium]
MNDPWKYLAFPAAAVGGYVFAQTQAVIFFKQSIGLSQYVAELSAVAIAGFIAGFMVDEVIPAYVEKVRSGSGGMGGDIGGGMDDDFDFDQ